MNNKKDESNASPFSLYMKAAYERRQNPLQPKKIGPKRIVLLLLILVVILAAIGIYRGLVVDADITPSTKQRQPITTTVNEPGVTYVYDGDWADVSDLLESELTTFYKQTGVVPYLYLTKEGAYKTQKELDSFAKGLFDSTFTDESHFLYVYCPQEDGTYLECIVVGKDAATVLDEEAIQIFKDYVAKSSKENAHIKSEILPSAYRFTTWRILDVTGWNFTLTIYVIVGAIALGFLIYLAFFKKSKEPKEEKKDE